jgi:hypothetical protein
VSPAKSFFISSVSSKPLFTVTLSASEGEAFLTFGFVVVRLHHFLVRRRSVEQWLGNF